MLLMITLSGISYLSINNCFKYLIHKKTIKQLLYTNKLFDKVLIVVYTYTNYNAIILYLVKNIVDSSNTITII